MNSTKYMKTNIYIAGFVTAFLLLGWVLALVMGMPNHLLMLAAGSIMLLFVYLPLVIRKRKIHKERMKEIIHTYQNKNAENGDQSLDKKPGEEISDEKNGDERKGWSMNNSPFRERRSGLTWGGGNIHAANATRGNRKRGK